MKELTNDQRQEYWAKYIRYRWEITRRNKDYRSEYEDLRNTSDEATKHSKKIKMASKWGFAVDPQNLEPYFLEMGYGVPGNLKIIKSPLVDFLIDEGLMTLIGKGNDPNSIDNEIIISVDINGPDWLTIASLENILKTIRFTTEIIDRRVSWDYLDDYLEIYDLNEAGFSNEQIAKKVFLKNLDDTENDIEMEMESAIRKVRRYLKKARELIQSGQIIWKIMCP